MQTIRQMGATPATEPQQEQAPEQAQQGTVPAPAQQVAGASVPRFRDWAAI